MQYTFIIFTPADFQVYQYLRTGLSALKKKTTKKRKEE